MNRRKRSLSHWYPRYVGDIMKKTAHLSMAGMGAYDRLMDYYYANGEALSANAPDLHRICGAISTQEQAIVDLIVLKFFFLKDGKYHNERADEELEHRKHIKEVRKGAQAVREGKRRGANAPANDPAKPPTSTSTIGISKDIPPIPPLEAEMFFTSVWEAYPGRGKFGAKGAGFKGNRKKAFEKFQKLLKAETDHDRFTRELIEGAYVYRDFLDRTGTPSKHLITWLNGECWRDDYSTDDGAPTGGDNIHARALAEGVRRVMQSHEGPDGDEFGPVSPVSSDE